MATRRTAREVIDLLVDAGTWRSWDAKPDQGTVSDVYAAELAAATERSGSDESVTTGEGLIHGRRIAILAGDFGFLAGSVGRAAGERLTTAIERATAERLPLLAATASGGTRMQEGTPALVGMAMITAALVAHRRAHLPYLVYLRDPTVGGVMASWGSLGHVTAAEPGALVGFLGPRVYKAIFGEDFPEGVQTAENLHRCGLIDAVIPIEELAGEVDRALNVLVAPMEPLPPDPGLDPEDSVADADLLPDIAAWDLITRSRNPERPGIRRLLRYGATDVVRLQGTGEGEHDPGLVLALARFGGAPCVFLGQDRRGQSEENPMGPAALAAARRGVRLSRQLGLPLVTLIDTRGAALTKEAEERGLAGEIARTLADVIDLPSPTVSVLIGEGTGGGALALVPADRMIAAQHGWLSPLPPEGASAIVHRTTARAPEMAAAQGIRAKDLLARGIVDHVVIERPDAADEPEEFCRRMGRVLSHELLKLMAMDPEERYAARLLRLRHLGE